MGAFTSLVLSLVQGGDEVVALDVLYGGTLSVLADVLPRFGVSVRFVTDLESREPEAVLSTKTRLVVIESPTNPLLTVHDIARWGRAADAVGAVLVVDNTFATPINQNPLALGADLVFHSATKYLAGHSDLVAGGVVGPKDLLSRIDAKGDFGSALDPFAAYLLGRSLKTLALRVARHNENGRRVAEALAAHPLVRRVYYPGRASAEEEAIASRQMRGRGGMVTVSLNGGAELAERFLRRLRFVHVASSLGGVDSLASVPGLTSHRHLPPEERARRGIDDGLIRFSFGIEDPEDLVRDLTEALDSLR
jgi:cystathionine beta-lyase/cystathionine gamma-synthase